MLFRPGRVLALVLAVLLLSAGVLLFSPREQPPSPAPESVLTGGLVNEQVMRQVAAIEAKHRQWNATVWADEMTARQYGEVVIQIWDKLRAGADPFQLLGGITFREIYLGQPQTAEEWESGIRRIRLVKGGPSLSMEQFGQALDHWKASGWRLEQSEWRHRR
ncbi:MAG: hypothetical protein VYB66_00390, partial [Verrucomicrobiota bacterium]|nr:hypothetical protein [Verrucomicrobiota bacterium]